MKKVVAFFVAVVAVAGLSAFVTLLLCEPERRGEHAAAHAWLHRELKLTSVQERALEPIETQFAEEYRRLETALVEAKRALARAMAKDKVYSPGVATAVESVHQRMGDMKQASIRHVFDMRAVLSPEQGDKLLTLAQRALEQSH